MRANSWMIITLGFALTIGSSGCVRVPHKDPVLHFSNFPESPPQPNGNTKIASAYFDLATAKPANHHLMLLEIGDDALLARIHLIRGATERIDIQTFIWKEDEVTRVIYQELLEAARRGVKVRVLVDALNPITGNTRLAQMAVAHPNLEFAVFRPLSMSTEPGHINKLETLFMKMRRLNRRMHNKLLLADDKVGIIGGRNYENKYFDRNPVMIFKDLDVLVIGPDTENMTDMFEAFWSHRDSVYLTQFKDVQARLPLDTPLEIFVHPGDTDSMKTTLSEANAYDLNEKRPHLNLIAVNNAAFFWDPPEKFKFGNRDYENEYGESIKKMLKSAKQQILLQSPYLIYQSRTKKTVDRLRKNNPDLMIQFSSNSLAAADHDIVYGVSFKNRKKLYKKLGLEIYEFKPFPADLLAFVPLYPSLYGHSPETILKYIRQENVLALFGMGPKLTIHAKSFVVDGRYSQIGSHNFDPRSSALNTECGLFVEDETFAKHLKANITQDMQGGNSWIVAKRNEEESLTSRLSGFIGAISNMLPIFDIWPYTYTSNFQLKPGCAPLPNSRHPDFYKHYEDVGQFPMVGKTVERIRAKFMKGFGGWTSPFM